MARQDLFRLRLADTLKLERKINLGRWADGRQRFLIEPYLILTAGQKVNGAQHCSLIEPQSPLLNNFAPIR